MQHLGLITPEITRLDLNGLGYRDADYQLVGFGMSDTEAQSIGRSLVGKSFMDIESALAALDDDDKKKIIVAYLAAGGDAKALEMAIQSSKTTITKGFDLPTGYKIAWGVASTISFAASVYHGYKRNNSLGWALWWGFMGSLFPVVTPVIAVAQGYAKPKRRR